jgi:UDP-glucose-4-epimerase GalE
MKTILITGGLGYIGSVTGFVCAQMGIRVVIIDKIQRIPDPTWAHVFIGDCTDTQFVASVCSQFTIDCIIHCAARIEVGQSVTHPLDFYHNNITGLLSMLKVMHAQCIPNLIFSSSSAVYGPSHEAILSVEHTTHPCNPYAASKVMGEDIIRHCSQAYGINATIMRYFNVAGALPEHQLGEHHQPETHVIPLLIHAAQTKKPFVIFGTNYPTKDGTALRDYVHVYDVARAHVKAYEHMIQTQQSDIFNIGTGIGTTIQELVALVQEIMNTQLTIHAGPERAGDCAQLVADISKTMRILEWKPTHSHIRTIMQSMIAYAQQR